MKITTTIPKLDEILSGGIEDGSSVLIFSNILVDKFTFIVRIFSTRLEEGDRGVYFTNNKLPSSVKKKIVNFKKFEDSVMFIDGLSFSLEEEFKETLKKSNHIKKGVTIIKERLSNVENFLKLLREKIKKVIGKFGYGTILVFDSLDCWLSNWNMVSKFVKDLKRLQKEMNVITFYLISDIGFDDNHVSKIMEDFDYVLHLKALERRGLILKFIEVSKPKIKTKIPFEITYSGISVYVPKILVTGPFYAGKSTVIKSLSEKPVSVDRLGTTIALDHGYVERRGFAVDLFGTPGQERFDWILDLLSKSVFGILLVVDSTKPETFDRAKEMLEKIRYRNIPVVVLANKQDLPNALKPEEVEQILGFPTVGTVAKTGKGCEEALEKLFELILKEETWYKL